MYVKQWKGCRISCDVGKAAEGLENELWHRWSNVRVGEWGSASFSYPSPQLVLQPFRCFTYVIHFTYVTTHSTTLPPLYLRQSSFYNTSVASPKSQALHVRHLANRPLFLRSSCKSRELFSFFLSNSFHFFLLFLLLCSFSNLSVTSPTSQLILQPFGCFTQVTTHSPTLPSLYLRHSSFSNPSVASPTSQFILQPFFHFSYVTSSSLIHLASRRCFLSFFLSFVRSISFLFFLFFLLLFCNSSILDIFTSVTFTLYMKL